VDVLAAGGRRPAIRDGNDDGRSALKQFLNKRRRMVDVLQYQQAQDHIVAAIDFPVPKVLVNHADAVVRVTVRGKLDGRPLEPVEPFQIAATQANAAAYIQQRGSLGTEPVLVIEDRSVVGQILPAPPILIVR
jgi:hypothetical protein